MGKSKVQWGSLFLGALSSIVLATGCTNVQDGYFSKQKLNPEHLTSNDPESGPGADSPNNNGGDNGGGDDSGGGGGTTGGTDPTDPPPTGGTDPTDPPPGDGGTDPTDPPPTKTCWMESFVQRPISEVPHNLDVLIVADSSSSLNQERTTVAEGLANFTSELPAGTNAKFAVMLATAMEATDPNANNTHPNFYSGKLMQTPSRGDPAILDTTVHTTQQIVENIRDIKFDYMVDNNPWSSPNNSSEKDIPDGGAGEAGFYSISRAIAVQSRLDEIRTQGFFRRDANLAVIFVSDENDICASHYDAPTNYAKLNQDERNARGYYCGAAGTRSEVDQDVNETFVYNKLKALQEENHNSLLVSTITHNNPATAPADSYYNSGDGYGYGYMELIQMIATSGVSFLSSFDTDIEQTATQIKSKLADIGKLAYQQLISKDTQFESAGGEATSADHVWVNHDEVTFTWVNDKKVVEISPDLVVGDTVTVDVSFCK